MKRRIFSSILLSAFIVLSVTLYIVMASIYNEFAMERKAEIVTETQYIASAYSQDYINYLKKIGPQSKNRITLISPEGNVIYDNFADSDSLADHSQRPEVIQAINQGYGQAERDSVTLSEKTFYYAIQNPDKSIIRVAATLKSIRKVIDNTAWSIFMVYGFAVVLSIVMAKYLTKRIVSPINKIDPIDPLDTVCYDELSPLLIGLDKQNKMIEEQLKLLNSSQREFSHVINGMSEALIIFGADKKVISINKSAEKLFGTYNAVGLNYLNLCSEKEYLNAIDAAFRGKASETKMKKNGSVYRLSVNPVEGNDSYAAVAFAVDITDTEYAEAMRREFSANVSHELKTPLTGILGCAEMLTSGIVKPEDYVHFSKLIYDEAKRLMDLIEDIIKVSNLDENNIKEHFEAVDLYETALQVTNELSSKAQKNDITLILNAQHSVVNGIKSLIYEMVFNLCDNAINYNVKGGKVTVSVCRNSDNTILSVADTGIGIAKEYQERIFERFYRVDKSHSKKTGGTGLGLSIVKHAASINNAKIKLVSALGSGSEISLIFPIVSEKDE